HGSGGEPLVRGFSEYAMPHARDLPAFETSHTQIPTKLNPLGIRGVGEGATIGATPAVVNAVLDALAPLGVTEVPIPMTPMRVWRAGTGTRRFPSRLVACRRADARELRS